MSINLQELNQKIAKAEDDGDVPFFRSLLSESLLFRRANGAVVGKAQFLHGMEDPNRPKLRRVPENIQVTQLPEAENHALVTLIVRTIDEKEGEKRYQNIRFFTKTGTEWELAFWYNYDITGL
jgi:Domain of unknown function (DUF4440)